MVAFCRRLFSAAATLGDTITAKITLEKISAQAIRVTLVADVQFSGNLDSFAPVSGARHIADPAASSTPPAHDRSGQKDELLTVEEAAELLHVGRSQVYDLIRTGRLRSIKIGKLRRIARAWIGEFVRQQLESQMP